MWDQVLGAAGAAAVAVALAVAPGPPDRPGPARGECDDVPLLTHLTGTLDRSGDRWLVDRTDVDFGARWYLKDTRERADRPRRRRRDRGVGG